ncbi:TPA: hypothetical protein ACXDAZ_002643 [Clostridium botulinum]
MKYDDVSIREVELGFVIGEALSLIEQNKIEEAKNLLQKEHNKIKKI